MTAVNPPPTPGLGRLLLTGAAGTLGRQLAAPLRALCHTLVLSDLPGALAGWQAQGGLPAADDARFSGPNDTRTASTADTVRAVELIPCDLADAGAVHRLLQGVDAVLHLGGVAQEGPFAPIVMANVLGLHHLYDAARRQGTRRIVLASSNHVTGGHARGKRLRPSDPPAPDGHYGLSKLYGEQLADLCWRRDGIESVCLRIGSATAEPQDRRSLATWISPGDLLRLVVAALSAPDVGCTVAYGCSANTGRWWDSDAEWARLAYAPQDNAQDWAAQVGHIDFPQGSAMAQRQGGNFLGILPPLLPGDMARPAAWSGQHSAASPPASPAPQQMPQPPDR